MADLDILLSRLDQLERAVKDISIPSPQAPDEIIDTKELCRRLAISEPTCIKMRQQKKIPSIKIGNSVRFNWPKVITAIEQKK
jgi:excisionase family DNA binding protein